MITESDFNKNKENGGSGSLREAVKNTAEFTADCGKGVKLSENGEFLSMNLGEYDKERGKYAENAEAVNTVFDEFLDEPVDAELPEELDIDPELAAEWERRLAESFKNDPISSDYDEPQLYAVRKRRPRKK